MNYCIIDNKTTVIGCHGHKRRRSRVTTLCPPPVYDPSGARFESGGSCQLVWVTHEACQL